MKALEDAYQKGLEAGYESGRKGFWQRYAGRDLPISHEAMRGQLETEATRLELEMRIYPKDLPISTKQTPLKVSRDGVLQALAQGVYASTEKREKEGSTEFIREHLVSLIRKCQWFDFGIVKCDRIDADQTDWRPFAERGLVELPFPETVFRVRLDVSDYESGLPTGKDLLDILWCARQVDGRIDLLTLFCDQLVSVTGLSVGGFNSKTKPEMQAHAVSFNEAESVSNMFFAFWMILNTKNIPTKEIVPDAKLNAARVKSGKQPLLPYIAVDTESYITALRETERMESEEGGAHRSPRPHLRRAHLRHLRSGVIGSADLKLAERERYDVKL